MLSRTQFSESAAVMPQLVGHVESSSTTLKPSPFSWASKAVRTAFLA